MRVWLACVAVLASVLAGCSSGPPAGQQSSDTLVIALSDEPSNLNPIFGDLYGSIYGDHWPIFSSLLDYDRNIDLVPDLASGLPQASPDGRTVTVGLREGVRWHDGQPFGSADVVFTYRAFLDPAVATGLRDELFDSLAAVDALDARTVRFTLSRPDPAFADKLTLGIVPEHVLAGQDLNTTPFNLAPIGTGPFRFEELRPGERLTLVANSEYHGGRVGIPRVVFSFVPDENVRATRLRSGELDVDAVGLPPRVADLVAGAGGVRLVRIPGESSVLLLPQQNPVFADPAVRQAVGLAVDRQAIAQGVFAGAAQPAVSPIYAGHWAAPDLPVPARDLAAAARLLDQAGWVSGPDGVRTRNGAALTAAMIYSAGSTVGANTALALRDQLAAIGMRVEPQGLGYEAGVERLTAGDSYLNTQGAAYDPDLDFYNTFHWTGDPATSNRVRMNSPQVEAALAASRATADRASRAAAYAELVRALAADGSYLYLVQGQNSLMVADRVQGVAPQVREGHIHGFSRGLMWNLHEWTLAS